MSKLKELNPSLAAQIEKLGKANVEEQKAILSGGLIKNLWDWVKQHPDQITTVVQAILTALGVFARPVQGLATVAEHEALEFSTAQAFDLLLILKLLGNLPAVIAQIQAVVGSPTAANIAALIQSLEALWAAIAPAPTPVTPTAAPVTPTTGPVVVI